MRNGPFVFAVIAIWASACALQEDFESAEGEESPDEVAWQQSPDEGIDPGESADLIEGDADDDASLAGCSVVEYCNAPGGDGTRCRQTGCSIPTAIAECKADVAAVCGKATCPWIFTSVTGARRDLCLN